MKILVTGSSGLIGSEAVAYFDQQGHEVHGIDNKMGMEFFGPGGDTRWNRHRLEALCRGFKHHEIDVRNRQGILEFFQQVPVDLVIHCAAQPSHDLARSRPFDDFDVWVGVRRRASMKASTEAVSYITRAPTLIQDNG